MGFEWMFRLVDRASGPATSIERQLTKVSSALKLLDISAKQTRLEKLTDPLKKQRLELQIQRDKLLLSKKAFDDYGRASEKSTQKGLGFLHELHDVVHLAEMAGGALERLGDKAIEMGRDVARAISFKESQMLGLKSAFGAKEGAAMFEQFEKRAVRTGRPMQELLGRANRFSEFVPKNLIEPFVTATEDIDVRFPGMGKGESAMEGLAGALSQDKLTEQWFRPFKGILDKSTMLQGMARANGSKSVAAFEAQLKHGQVDPRVLFQGFADAVVKMDKGPIGTLSNTFSETLPGKMGRAEAIWDRLMSGVSTTKGYKTFMAAFENLLSALSSSKAQKLVNDFADRLGAMLEPLTGPQGKKRMEEFFGRLEEMARKTLPAISALASGVERMTKWFAPSAADKAQEMADALSKGGPDQQFMKGGRRVSAEEYFDLPGGAAATKKLTTDLERRARQERESDRKSNGSFGAEVPVMVPGAMAGAGAGAAAPTIADRVATSPAAAASKPLQIEPIILREPAFTAQAEAFAETVAAQWAEPQTAARKPIADRLGELPAAQRTIEIENSQTKTLERESFVEKLLQPPALARTPAKRDADARAPGTPASKGSRNVTIHTLQMPITVNVPGANKDNAHEIARAVRDQVPAALADALEQIATETGG